jgi:hypothetical protein
LAGTLSVTDVRWHCRRISCMVCFLFMMS